MKLLLLLIAAAAAVADADVLSCGPATDAYKSAWCAAPQLTQPPHEGRISRSFMHSVKLAPRRNCSRSTAR